MSGRLERMFFQRFLFTESVVMEARRASTWRSPAITLVGLVADVAKALGVSEADVMAVIEAGELKAKKIGTSYRVTRAALDSYLAQ